MNLTISTDDQIRVAYRDLVIWLGRLNRSIPTLAQFTSLSQSQRIQFWESTRSDYVRHRAEHNWRDMNLKLRNR